MLLLTKLEPHFLPQSIQNPQYDLNFLTPRSVPLFCGPTGFVFQTAFEIFGEYPLADSEVRSKGNLDNPIVAMITFTYNPKWNKGTLLMTIPETGSRKTDFISRVVYLQSRHVKACFCV